MGELMPDHGSTVVGTALQRSLKKYGVKLYLARVEHLQTSGKLKRFFKE